MNQSKGGIVISTAEKRKIFVVYGRNLMASDAIFQFLRAIGLTPIEWNQAAALTHKATPYVGEILDAAFSHAQAVVVLLTGDDEVRLRRDFLSGDDHNYERKLMPQARPNVLFEAGMAFGRHADRTDIIKLGELRPFSDISGRHVIEMNNSTMKR
jgi:predicted nucleotide-binding protein